MNTLSLLLFAGLSGGQLTPETISIGGPTSPDGSLEVRVDMPIPQRIKNIGSHVDGAGMCVMSSIEMSARWQNLEALRGLRDWCARQPGGGYPQKVDRQLREYCTQAQVNVPRYVQYEGNNTEILRLCLHTGRLASVTYAGMDQVRYQGRIAHMVCLAHFDDKWACVLDNNGIGERELLWMNPQEFTQRWSHGGGGWAFVWLNPPPPPPPRGLTGPQPRHLLRYGSTGQDRPVYFWEQELIYPDVWWCKPANGRSVGAWSVENQCYLARGRDGTYENGEYTNPPIPPLPEMLRNPAPSPLPVPSPLPPRQPWPPDEPSRETAVRNYGMNWEFTRERFVVNGQDVSREEFIAAIMDDRYADSIPDDTDYLRVTVIGQDATLRRQVVHEISESPEFAAWKGKLCIQDYAPDNWAVQCGFSTGGSPTIYVQSPDGTVLHRQDDYKDGAAGLASALRKVDPNYRPDQDKDRRKDPVVAPMKIDFWLVAAVIGVVLLVVVLKDK